MFPIILFLKSGSSLYKCLQKKKINQVVTMGARKTQTKHYAFKNVMLPHTEQRKPKGA